MSKVPPEGIKRFFYENDEIDNDEYKKILNYLYQTKNDDDFLKKLNDEVSNLIERYNSEIKNLEEKKDSEANNYLEDLKARVAGLHENTEKTYVEIIESLRNKFKENKYIYDNYIKSLKESLMVSNREINHIVVYEAPPFTGEYILSSQTSNNLKISTYWSPIKEVMTSIDIRKYDENVSPIDNLVNYNIGFIDLSLVPLPLKNIREEWSVKTEFNLNDSGKDKQLPVYLFELAVKDFIEKIGDDKIDANPKIAIGIPNKTSISIFDYFTNNHFSYKGIKLNISEPNPVDIKEEFLAFQEVLKSRTLRLHKNNVTSGSGFPNGLLMKMAFDLERIKKKIVS
jgi:hypothetical protein